MNKLLIHQLDITNDDYRDQILICMYTGMRVGEVLALTKDDIDLTNNVIHVNRTLTRGKDDKYIVGDTTKTYAGVREVPILAVLKPILRQYMFRPGYLFIRKLIVKILHFLRVYVAITHSDLYLRAFYLP